MVIMQCVEVKIWGFTLWWQKCDKAGQSVKKMWCNAAKKCEKCKRPLTIITIACCIVRVFCIWLGVAYLDVKISICFWRRLFTFVTGTAFLALVDGTKQAEPVGCFIIYRSKSHLKTIFFQVQYLGAYVQFLFFSSGDVFYLAVTIILCLPLTGGHCLTNIAKLGQFLS